jgi:hypothetical protein
MGTSTSGGAASDAAQTKKEADAALKKGEAKAVGEKISASSETHDSPKRHGDKLEHATQAAAKGSVID